MDKNANTQKEYDSYESRIRTYKQEERRLSIAIKDLTKQEKKTLKDARDAEERRNDILATLPEASKKVSNKQKELGKAETVLADTIVHVEHEMDKLEKAKSDIEDKLVELSTKQIELDKQIKSYHSLCNEIADERREVECLKTSLKAKNKEQVRVMQGLKRQGSDIEIQARKLNGKVAEYDKKIEGAKISQNNYESLKIAHNVDRQEINKLKKQLDEEIKAYTERNAELYVAEQDAERLEKEANALKLSFEKQIEALDEKETKLEIFKLKLNKQAKKIGMEKELADLMK